MIGNWHGKEDYYMRKLGMNENVQEICVEIDILIWRIYYA